MRNQVGTLPGLHLRELETFLLIFSERGVVKAKKKLGVGQPAVSNTLASLRDKFDDALFTRPNCQPTAKCLKIALILMPIMEELHNAIEALQPLTFRSESIGSTSSARGRAVSYEP